jgi:ribose transport system substrate-binding protein
MYAVLRRMVPNRRRLFGRAAVGMLIAVVGVLVATSASAAKSYRATHAPPYTFVLSNNFLGNDWRPQVEKLAQLTVKLPPFAGKVNLKIVNSSNTNQAQIGDLNSIIETKPDAIILIPGSSTALDPAIQRACSAGILVLTLSAPVTAPCAINFNQDFYSGNVVMGEWMAKVLKGTGSVFIDHGIPGLSISKLIESGFRAGLKKYGPNIKVVGTYNGQYAAGPEQAGISSLLTAHPDVSGVMTQGYCTPVFNALKAAGKPAVPAICYGYDGEMTACAQSGHECAILTNAPGQVQSTMELALGILQGTKPKPHSGYAQKYWVSYPMTVYVTATPKVNLVKPNVPLFTIQTLKSGVNFFPKLAAGLSLPYTNSNYAKLITPEEAAGK